MGGICRSAVGAGLLFGLSGCNNVVSTEPWFTAADTQGVPKFRDGLWLSTDDADCRVNVARPAERWPNCAHASFVRGDEWLAMEWDNPDGRRRRVFVGWQTDRTLVANGDPLIGQVETEQEPSGPSNAAEAGLEEPSWRYLYYAIQPTRLDEEGQVLAFELWGIKCGPPPEPTGDPDEAVGNVSEQPFPGLTIAGSNCTAGSVEALRRAAVLSEPLEAHGTARWIRDGWR
jgi:hypothetical protein